MDKMDEIDRILSEDPVQRPSRDFSARVMTAVRQEAATPEPIPFPWQRLLPGMLTSLSLSLATFMALGWLGESPEGNGAETAAAIMAYLSTATGTGLLIAGAALLFTAALSWWALSATRSPSVGI
jgi:hypothetical protein